MEELSIRQIVERCQQGDRVAFGLLYDTMEERLRRVCRRYVTDGSAIDDLVHDAFLLIFSKIDTLKDTARAEAWMLTVTKNLALVYAEHRRNDPTVSFEEVRQPLTASAPSALPVTYDEILHLVEVLPEGCRRVFRLSVLEGLSHQQIAALLNIEPHTSSSQLFRAKKLLRQALAVLLVCLLVILLPIGVWKMMKEFELTVEKPEGQDRPQAGVKPLQKPTAEEALKGRQKDLPLLRGLNKSLSDNRGFTPACGLNAPSGLSADQSTDIVVNQPSELSADQSAAIVANQPTDTTTQKTMIPSTDHGHQVDLAQSASDIGRGSDRSPFAHTGGGRNHPHWTLQLAYSGMGGQRIGDLPYADADTNDPPMDTVTRHQMPLTFGIQLSKPISRYFSVGTGLQYTLLRSETQTGNTYALTTDRQCIGYLGLPLRVNLSLWENEKMRNGENEKMRNGGNGTFRRWTAYATASAMVELPLHATVKSHTQVNGLDVEHGEHSLSLPWQWSVGTALGVEYRLTPVIGFFAEPTLQYFFRSGSTPETWRTDHPATFSVPIGVRINIK